MFLYTIIMARTNGGPSHNIYAVLGSEFSAGSCESSCKCCDSRISRRISLVTPGLICIALISIILNLCPSFDVCGVSSSRPSTVILSPFLNVLATYSAWSPQNVTRKKSASRLVLLESLLQASLTLLPHWSSKWKTTGTVLSWSLPDIPEKCRYCLMQTLGSNQE